MKKFLSLLFLFLLIISGGIYLTHNSYSAGPCDPPVNIIVCENSKPGNPESEWDIGRTGAVDTIEGFADAFSSNAGQTVNFKIRTVASSFKIDVYRIGYYQGNGARKVASPTPIPGVSQNQPECLIDQKTRLYDCGNWGVSASWTIPNDAVSGFYVARIDRTDGTPGANHIYFVVRNDSSHADMLFQMSDTTWQAYNHYGGASLYYNGEYPGRFHDPRPAYKVSYNRPFIVRAAAHNNAPFWSEYAMIRWLERNGYDVTYFAGVDSDRFGQLIKNHKIFMSVGHDEYWSADQRKHVEEARDAGVNLAFFSANEVFWKTRWENSIANPSDSYKTLVTYKETSADNGKRDPKAGTWTGTWRDPRNSPPDDGGRPENALTGTIFTVNAPTFEEIEIPYEYARMRLWRNTSIASISPGQVVKLPRGILGFEWDEDIDNGHRPAGLIRFSRTTRNVESYIQDHGDVYAPGIATHSATLYKAPSGARVFGSGTINWPWGLDNHRDPSAWTPPIELTEEDVRIQQATVNLFADMGVQATTLQSNLVQTTASQDSTAPTSAITSPSNGASISNATYVTVKGTASDQGGVVGGVEISTDNGQTWHPVTHGIDNWSYDWRPSATGSHIIKTRAVDDSGNIQTSNTSITVTINSIAPVPPAPPKYQIPPLRPTIVGQVNRVAGPDGRRFWTSDPEEVWNLEDSGSIDEGQAFYAYEPHYYVPPGTVPLYRLLKEDTGDYFWTMNVDEVHMLTAGGFTFQGTAFYVFSPYNPQPPNSQSVYRLFNPSNGQRFFTTNLDEVTLLINNGWTNEGVAFYTPLS